jgi:hypothetical protein
MMRFFDDTISQRPLIEETIKRFGYAPEHNFDWYQFSAEKTEKNIFVTDEYGGGLLTMVGKDLSLVFSSPIAPPERRAKILVEYLENIFQTPEIKKVELELETPLRKEFLKILPEHFVARKIQYTLTWPIMNMKTFDPALPGGHYKSLRKEKHKFYREHTVTVADAKTFEDTGAMLAIIKDWKKNRPVHDKAYCEEYLNIIEGGFAGTTTARVLIIDGKPAGINAGWVIPNSNRFYGALGLHNYSVPNSGKILYLEDLEYLKQNGYSEGDMGGSWQGGLEFKKEFLPESYYKTHVFCVAKK